jgi:hypothetical protein
MMSAFARGYEAMKVSQGFRRHTFRTFEEATQYFTRP